MELNFARFLAFSKIEVCSQTRSKMFAFMTLVVLTEMVHIRKVEKGHTSSESMFIPYPNIERELLFSLST